QITNHKRSNSITLLLSKLLPNNWWHEALFKSTENISILILDLWLMNKSQLRTIRQTLEDIFEWISKQWNLYYNNSTKEFQIKWSCYKKLQHFYIKQAKLKKKLLKSWFKNEKKLINQHYKTLLKQQQENTIQNINIKPNESDASD